jgi:2-polyprenyl-6-methoxyphenol hydroxylase-like FAD-dependent oxidoreductase
MKTLMDNSKRQLLYDVIISGAGPVGLFLACELGLTKCSVLILEKADNPQSPLKQLPFGIRGLSAPTIEAVYRRGLLKELEIHKRLKNPHQNAEQGPRRQVGHFAGIPFREGDIDASQWKYRLPSSTDTSLISEMQELETVLTRRAEALGVEIKRGLAVTDFQQTEDGVTVQSGDQSFQSKWLVGCDGARSAVRKTGGFEFAGTEPEFTGYTTSVDIADPEKLKPGRNVTSKGMYLQSQPGYVLIQDFDGGAFHNSEKPITREHVQEVLRRISNTDVTINALRVATTWTDRARQATTYRNGRILERHPIGAQVLDWSRAQVAVMGTGAQGRALHAIFRDLMNTRDGATYMAARVWGVFTHYDLGGDHPLVGHSVPNFEFEDGTKVGELLQDGQGMLLDFDRNASLKTLASEYNNRMKFVSGRAKEQLGLSAVLIRPDGIVAWASESEPNGESIREAVARWFAR